MTTELLKNITVPNVVCHFCGQAKPPYQTVIRGHFRLCRECLLKHQVDVVVMGTREIEDTAINE
jgi:hypothetical protein